MAIDIDQRNVIGKWDTGCGGSHGIPVVDERRGFVFAGCSSKGGGAVLDSDDGTLLAGHEVGSGDALLAYSEALGHFYLRGDPGNFVDILGVCDDGALELLDRVKITHSGHGITADERGNVWVCDAENGGLLHFHDSFPASFVSP